VIFVKEWVLFKGTLNWLLTSSLALIDSSRRSNTEENVNLGRLLWDCSLPII
jgi:hypothetical protein